MELPLDKKYPNVLCLELHFQMSFWNQAGFLNLLLYFCKACVLSKGQANVFYYAIDKLINTALPMWQGVAFCLYDLFDFYT